MKRFMIFVVFVLALAFITINLPGVKQAYSETLTETKVDVYDQQKLVKSLVFAIGLNKYFVDGKVDGVTMDAKPFIQDGRTFVPVRFLSNALGVQDKNIHWDGSVQKVTLMAWNRVEMAVGSPAIAVTIAGAGRPDLKIIDVAPMLKSEEGRTYLPARYIAEGLGYEVGWDEATETVLCWPKGEAKPDVSAVVQKAVEERARLEGKQPDQKPEDKKVPPGYKVTSMGYMVPSPENTRMKIEDQSQDVNLTLVIYLPHTAKEIDKVPLEHRITQDIFQAQLQQAEEILAGKHGREIAKAAVDYARKKTTREAELERKKFPLPEGGKIAVAGYYNAWYIVIDVWRI
ncbi:MAG: hypothetical protein VR68_13710 [Peptococcaceae bacterium BRH_c4a]|nr:MAG: hypothetical protein VR68_13710 [Peptococcaceae bacterium BRH_c4a]